VLNKDLKGTKQTIEAIKMFDQYICTNINCNYQKKGKKGKKCPQCGESFSKVGMMEGTNIIQQKRKKFS
jgi:rubrerythrin